MERSVVRDFNSLHGHGSVQVRITPTVVIDSKSHTILITAIILPHYTSLLFCIYCNRAPVLSPGHMSWQGLCMTIWPPIRLRVGGGSEGGGRGPPKR